MKPGRRPTPTNLRVLRGNPSKRPVNRNEPQPKPRMRTPPAPPHLGPVGQREWKRLAKELVSQGLLTTLDLTALRLYCDSFETYASAIKSIRELGSTVSTPNDYLQTSPYVHLANKAHAQMLQMMEQFGMTPAARSRVEVGPKTADHDAVEEFLFGSLRESTLGKGS